jgi:hypothetical protein
MQKLLFGLYIETKQLKKERMLLMMQKLHQRQEQQILKARHNILTLMMTQTVKENLQIDRSNLF